MDMWSGTAPALELRLYRPGYRTVRVHCGQRVNDVTWEPAVTPGEQEQAVDELLFACDDDRPRWPPPEAPRQPREFQNLLLDWKGLRAGLSTRPGMRIMFHDPHPVD
jgi:hypothetical protein